VCISRGKYARLALASLYYRLPHLASLIIIFTFRTLPRCGPTYVPLKSNMIGLLSIPAQCRMGRRKSLLYIAGLQRFRSERNGLPQRESYPTPNLKAPVETASQTSECFLLFASLIYFSDHFFSFRIASLLNRIMYGAFNNGQAPRIIEAGIGFSRQKPDSPAVGSPKIGTFSREVMQPSDWLREM
jgi:hypothetical protein